MYVNPLYAERELSVLHDTIEAVRFGLLVLCADGPLAAHIPFVLHRDEGRYGTLVAHVAGKDPLARHLDGGPETIAIFSGPRAYVSPRWCPNDVLPTYNFVAVHAGGRPRVLKDDGAVLAHLAELIDVHEERSSPSPWSIASASESYVAGLLPNIVAFKLEIDAIQGKRKLSQNRAVEDREGVMHGLRERGGDDDQAIAEAMAVYPYDAQNGATGGTSTFDRRRP
jgi:transcriptional regulator